MRRNFIWALMIACSMLSSDVSADTVIFDFNNNTELDSDAPAGTTMPATGTTDTVVLTTVGVFAPEFEEATPDVFALTGNTIDAATTIGSGPNALSVNNPTIGNTDFETFKGNTSGTEGTDLNLGESIVIEFDTDVTIQEFNFSSIDDAGFVIVEVEGVATAFDFVDGSPGDDFQDPFAGMVITAGTDITFSVGSASQDAMGQDASVRISEITVETMGGATVILGDVDRSGTVDFLDINAFIAILSSGGFQAEADVDLSGTVDFLDIDPFIAILAGG